MQTHTTSPTNQSLGTLCWRSFDYLALAELREKQATRTRNIHHKAFLLAAARYARRKAIEAQQGSASGND
ncbi:MAG: hypothetical protein AAGB19_00190 [Cyanobacteria bacterium P01_F01_bin.3]